jgi:hypothetical protein
MAEVSLRQPVQGFLRQCQILLDSLNGHERLTSLELVLLKAYVKRIRTCLMTKGYDHQDLSEPTLPDHDVLDSLLAPTLKHQ